jgi:signal transduction histidine kinase
LDITEQKELESQREAFVSMVTHELKTPLTSLQGNVQLAQRWLTRLFSQAEQLPPEQQHVLEEVLTMLSRSQQQLRIQHRLINDLLDVSRIQEDKLELRLTPCDLVELVYETVQDYQAAHPSRLIILELPEQDLLQVTADRDRLRQVLSNYLTNALKFSPDTEPVHVGLSLEVGNVRVWVQDHGPGLSHEQQQHIWKRFYQAPQPSNQSWSQVGLGLGLYICQQLINRQQGQVGIESTLGHGATFWFTLPLLSSCQQ